jgi:hypothetical protein
MSVQKTPDRRGGVDNDKTQWEQDLKPFSRLPRDKRPDPSQKAPAIIPLLISLAVVIPVCLLSLNALNRLRPAASSVLSFPTATLTIITPTATRFVPPTATPYVAPTDTPVPSPVPPPAASASGIAVGGRVRVTGTGGGLNFRDAPSIRGALLRKLPDGSVYEVVGGPREADNYVWWQLKDGTDGVTGWGAQTFLQPVE